MGRHLPPHTRLSPPVLAYGYAREYLLSGKTPEELSELSRDLSPELHAGKGRGCFRSRCVRAGLWATLSLQSVWGREPAAGVVGALVAFLKESGKLKAPEWVGGGVPKARASRRGDCFGMRAACPAQHLSLPGGAGVSSVPGARGGRQRHRVMPSHFSPRSKPRRAWKWCERTKMGAAN
ncbi:unnamed protein product [Gulo gulo]|uniref:Uncharacterized protein n=1 Tax=Gulo gulo TaxID=48420 RepID=A0A9X9M1Z8_GULGU|nr:unnamed protein product [Gulo gulo]